MDHIFSLQIIFSSSLVEIPAVGHTVLKIFQFLRFSTNKSLQVLKFLLNCFMVFLFCVCVAKQGKISLWLKKLKYYLKLISIYLWIRWNSNNLICQTKTWSSSFTIKKFSHSFLCAASYANASPSLTMASGQLAYCSTDSAPDRCGEY